MSLPCVGRSPTGWQFRQRGCWSTCPPRRTARATARRGRPPWRSCRPGAGPPRPPRRRGPWPGKAWTPICRSGSFIVPFLRAARVLGPARMGRRWQSVLPNDNAPPRPACTGRATFVAVPRTMILKSFVALTCLLATAMTIAQSSPSVPVAPREPKDVSVHGDRRIDDYFWLRAPRRPAHPALPAGRERLRRRLVRAARGAEGKALPGDVRPDPAGRRLGALSQGRLVVLDPHLEGRAVPALHAPARRSAPIAATTRAAATRRCST